MVFILCLNWFQSDLIMFTRNKLQKKTFKTIHQLLCFVGHPVGFLWGWYLACFLKLVNAAAATLVFRFFFGVDIFPA